MYTWITLHFRIFIRVISMWTIYPYFKTSNSIKPGGVSSGRNLFLPGRRKKLEETCFFQFLPVFTGRNWKKLEKTRYCTITASTLNSYHCKYICSVQVACIGQCNYERLKKSGKNEVIEIFLIFSQTTLEETGKNYIFYYNCK